MIAWLLSVPAGFGEGGGGHTVGIAYVQNRSLDNSGVDTTSVGISK